MSELWDFRRSEGGHYSKPLPCMPGMGMAALRAMFPEGSGNDLNFVLFSTSGVHGTYQTIEEEQSEPGIGITFVIVQPRIVAMRYGECYPQCREDFEFIKNLRSSSWDAVRTIGRANS